MNVFLLRSEYLPLVLGGVQHIEPARLLEGAVLVVGADVECVRFCVELDDALHLSINGTRPCQKCKKCAA